MSRFVSDSARRMVVGGSAAVGVALIGLNFVVILAPLGGLYLLVGLGLLRGIPKPAPS